MTAFCRVKIKLASAIYYIRTKLMSGAPKRSVYFFNPWTDFFLIGGASIILWCIAAGLGPRWSVWNFGFAQTDPLSVALYASWIINWPHFSATHFRLYRNQSNREEFPITSYLVPVVILGLLGMCFLFPNEFAPYFVKIFMIWSPYHFSAQSVGISLIYASRSGAPFQSFERSCLSLFIFSTYIYATLKADASTISSSYYGLIIPTLGIPQSIADAYEWILWGSGVALLVVFLKKKWIDRSSIHCIVLLPAVTQLVWFVVGSRTTNFLEFVPFFHSLQYLVLALPMHLHEQAALRQSSFRAYVFRESALWGVANILGGVILFFILPKCAMAMGVPDPVANACVLAAIQIHHFFVDGVIWKLKNPSVISPLAATWTGLKMRFVRETV